MKPKCIYILSTYFSLSYDLKTLSRDYSKMLQDVLVKNPKYCHKMNNNPKQVLILILKQYPCNSDCISKAPQCYCSF